MVVGLVVLVVAAAAGLVAWIAGRSRRAARREALRRECAELTAIAHAAKALPDSSPTGAAIAAGLVLELQQGAAVNLDAELQNAVPVLEPPSDAVDADAHLSSVERLFQQLDRNSVTVAGVEQVLLAAFGSTVSEAAAMSAALGQFAGVPEHLQQAMHDLVSYVCSPDFGVQVTASLHETITHAAHSVLPSMDAAGLHVGLVGKVAVKALTEGTFPSGTVAVWGAGQALHGMQDFVHHAGQVPVVHDAIQHLSHAGSATEGVIGVHGALGHVPWVTLAMSSVREFRLLSDGKTTIDSSVRNVTLDVTGTGGGAFVGFKLGALAGTAIAPGVGSVVGGLIGAIAGGMGGRAISNEVKAKPLQRAVAEYERLAAAYPVTLRTAAAGLSGSLGAKSLAARQQYGAAIGPAPTIAGTYEREIQALTSDLCRTTRAYADELALRASRARKLAHRGRLDASAPVTIERAVQESVTALRAVELLPTGAPALPALLNLGAAGLPLAAGTRYGEGYRAAWADTARRLRDMSDSHRDELQQWSHLVNEQFALVSAGFAEDIQPDLDAFRSVQTASLAALEAAGDTAKREAAKLKR